MLQGSPLTTKGSEKRELLPCVPLSDSSGSSIGTRRLRFRNRSQVTQRTIRIAEKHAEVQGCKVNVAETPIVIS